MSALAVESDTDILSESEDNDGEVMAAYPSLMKQLLGCTSTWTVLRPFVEPRSMAKDRYSAQSLNGRP